MVSSKLYSEIYNICLIIISYIKINIGCLVKLFFECNMKLSFSSTKKSFTSLFSNFDKVRISIILSRYTLSLLSFLFKICRRVSYLITLL